MIRIGRDISIDEFQIVFDVSGYYRNNEQTVSDSKEDHTKNHHISISRYDVFEYDSKNVTKRIFPVEWKPRKNGASNLNGCILEQRHFLPKKKWQPKCFTVSICSEINDVADERSWND